MARRKACPAMSGCFPPAGNRAFAVGINVVSAGQARPLINTQGCSARHRMSIRRFPGHARRRPRRLAGLPGRVLFPRGGGKGPVRPFPRGVAVDTGTMPGAEEFPEFTGFWIEDLRGRKGASAWSSTPCSKVHR
jgi:glucans biosynthesis protein